MEYTRLGQSGLSVSRVGLGCMSYGQAASGMHQWTLDEDAAAPFFRQAVELGVTFCGAPPSFRTTDLIGSAPEWRMENAGTAQEVYP
jgi:aryl-alcohol dehydrogenase-like predicted oxidoreductase